MRIDGVLGHQRVLGRLEAEMAAGRLAHAYLFVGPKGCGRSTTAQGLFKALNCHEQSGEFPCGQCPSCHRLQSGTHEDFMEIAPPSDALSAQIKAEDVREAIRTMGFAPFSGGTRMVLIKAAEHLNLTSANVLLKTLEEPPPNNIMVLTVQDAAEILPTLVSRCRRVNFAPLPDSLIAMELERQGRSPQASRLQAAMAAGSLGRARDMDQEKLAHDLGQLTGQLRRRSGALDDWAFADELVQGFRGGGRIDREGICEALDLLGLYFRDQAVLGAGSPCKPLLPDEFRFPAEMTLDACSRAFLGIREAQSKILGNATPELVLTVLLGKLRGLGERGV